MNTTNTSTAIPGPVLPSGYYWSWSGIQGVLGTSNAVDSSWLDQASRVDTTSADFQRVATIGAEADAWTNLRARNGAFAYQTPLPSTSKDWPLIQRATNLYAAFQLVRARIWFSGDNDSDASSRAMLSLRKQADDLYTALFGDAGSGVDGGVGTVGNVASAPGTFTAVPLRYDDEP